MDDEQFVAEAYHASYRRLVGQMFVLCGDLGTAEDVVQEAFVRALDHVRTFRRTDNPEAWLSRVAINLQRSLPDVLEPCVLKAEQALHAALDAQSKLKRDPPRLGVYLNSRAKADLGAAEVFYERVPKRYAARIDGRLLVWLAPAPKVAGLYGA